MAGEIGTLHVLTTSRKEGDIEDGLNRLVTYQAPDGRDSCGG